MQRGNTLLAAGLIFGLTALNVNANLSVTNNGLGVYDSGLNATWTQDANLLGTLEANAIANYDAEAQNLIGAIINASGGVIHDMTSFYILSASDFTTTGTYQGSTSWWGAQAFVNYLNQIDYANSKQWALPSTPDNNNSFGYYQSSSQLGELYTNELGLGVGGISGNFAYPAKENIGPFTNVQDSEYWSGTKYSANPINAWVFGTFNGFQGAADKGTRFPFYTWAVSPEQVSAVPVPAAIWLFGTGLLGVLGFNYRKQAVL